MLIKNTVCKDAFGGSLRESEKSDFTIMGIPFDAKTTYRSGTAKGPDAVRDISTVRSISSFTEQGIDLYEDTVIVDAGNIDFSGNNEDHIGLIEDHTREIIERGSIPVTIGGDHSITYPVVRAVRKKYSGLNIVWIDAHPDIYDEYEGDKYSHACPLSRIMELGGIANIIQGGIRATNRDLIKKQKENGIKVFGSNDFEKANGLCLEGPTYLSMDIDVLDPGFAPGVGTPVPGGISTRQLLNFIHTFNLQIIGFDLVEVNPEYDHASITAAAAAKIVMETIARVINIRNLKN